MATHDELLELENAGWRSLCNSTGADFYGSVMTPSGVMVLADGSVMTRDDVVRALEHAPPWSSHTIAEPRITPVTDDVMILTYIGTGHRERGDDFTGVMTSVYVRDPSGWKLALYQQTPTP